MTITELREIAAATSIQHAEFCLEQYTKTIDRDGADREAADLLWIEMANLVDDHWDDATDGME